MNQTRIESPRPVPGRIQVLPDALIDQIAAGEVVERPASVVKELVENSLDAGARTIQVEIRDGGAALVAVQDDGLGMTPDELPVALARHATSKLRSADDLMRIASFGFRGEALPAIASVSRFRVVSRARGTSIGHLLRIDAGRIVESRATGCPEGTRIEVADLFAAVPARRKFLKRPGTEWGHIADWLARLAMARPDIHLEVRRDDRAATVWPACRDRRDRLALLLPEEEAASLIEVDHADGERLHIHGFASSPENSRATGQGVHLFVNGRPVRDRLLSHALAEPYRDLLPRGRFPIAVLFVDVPPETVDVNVHPAKWEVRFSDPQAIHRAMRQAIRQAIGQRRWLALTPPRETVPTQIPVADFGTAPAGGAEAGGAQPDSWRARSAQRPLEVREAPTPIGSGIAAAGGERAATDWVLAGPATPDAPPVPSFASLRLLGQLHASYLLAESERGLVVVDQHAAHERILYEKLRRRWLESRVARQGLLEPQVLRIGAPALAAIEEAAELVASLGFEVESFGEDAVLLRALPAELVGSDPGALLRDLAAALAEAGRGRDEGAGSSAVRWMPVLDRFFATRACHAARRFGDRLPEAESRAILAGLDTIPWAPTCPHGRPVAVLLGTAELEARFRRR